MKKYFMMTFVAVLSIASSVLATGTVISLQDLTEAELTRRLTRLNEGEDCHLDRNLSYEAVSLSMSKSPVLTENREAIRHGLVIAEVMQMKARDALSATTTFKTNHKAKTVFEEWSNAATNFRNLLKAAEEKESKAKEGAVKKTSISTVKDIPAEEVFTLKDLVETHMAALVKTENLAFFADELAIVTRKYEFCFAAMWHAMMNEKYDESYKWSDLKGRWESHQKTLKALEPSLKDRAKATAGAAAATVTAAASSGDVKSDHASS